MVDLHELPYRFGDGDPIKGLNEVLDWGNTLSLGEQVSSGPICVHFSCTA
jgi:hypothetical protein